MIAVGLAGTFTTQMSYHLNASEEPENVDYPQNPEFKERFGPRGVIHSYADGRIEDTGQLTRKRMETIDDETLVLTEDFIRRANDADQPTLNRAPPASSFPA